MKPNPECKALKYGRNVYFAVVNRLFNASSSYTSRKKNKRSYIYLEDGDWFIYFKGRPEFSNYSDWEETINFNNLNSNLRKNIRRLSDQIEDIKKQDIDCSGCIYQNDYILKGECLDEYHPMA